MTRRGLNALLAITLAGLASPALAHPHVWITAKAEVVFAPDGRMTGIRHSWTFDEAFTAYATLGLDRNNDGKLTPDELQPLADENTASLSEFGYFTVVEVNGRKQAFEPPREPRMVMEKNQVALSFFLPLKTPALAHGTIGMEIDDPFFFVFFTLAEGKQSITLASAPRGCVITAAKAKELDTATKQMMQDEGVFQTAAGANIGVQYTNKAIIACP